MKPTSEEINKASEKAVALFLSELGGDLSTGRYVLVLEAIDENGDRGLWQSTAPGQASWDTLGLLNYMIQEEQAYMCSKEL